MPRHRLEIMAELIGLASQPKNITHLTRDARLNCTRARNHLNKLLEKELIKIVEFKRIAKRNAHALSSNPKTVTKIMYVRTEKALAYLRQFEKLKEMVE